MFGGESPESSGPGGYPLEIQDAESSWPRGADSWDFFPIRRSRAQN